MTSNHEGLVATLASGFSRTAAATSFLERTVTSYLFALGALVG